MELTMASLQSMGERGELGAAKREEALSILIL